LVYQIPSFPGHRIGKLSKMYLHALLREHFINTIGGLPDCEITKVTSDSRQVIPGALFVAVRGANFDGHQFHSDAVVCGADILMGEGPDPELGVPYIQVPDARLALAQLAAAWHGFPARKLVMIGVTGTDGKTTTTNLIHTILRNAGIKAGMITTVNALIGDHVLDTGLHVTTPDALEVQAFLAEMVATGLTHCVLEVTSHGLAQHRVSACDFDIGVVTNITHEHFDYHGSFEAYREAKGRLFSELAFSAPKSSAPIRTAILNRDDDSYPYLSEISKVREVSYGVEANADIVISEREITPQGIVFVARGPWYRQEIRSSLLGAYNISNCTAAFAAGVEGLGVAPEVCANGIEALSGIPGRMEMIKMGQPFLAIIDFAHTPNALKQALASTRQLTSGRVIAIFGSAGLRDREKRRMMAEVSIEAADLTILTAEDPRTESLENILEEMAEGARGKGAKEGEDFFRVPDRGEALRFAIERAEEGDLIIACGKGHEQSMCFGEVEHPWDDRVAMRAALADFMGVDGPEMPYLPTSE
jgi:UDP-N-acetylmuramoyl-L-alanyl-D-glutamate--2,6-diaminopimelate ligase